VSIKQRLAKHEASQQARILPTAYGVRIMRADESWDETATAGDGERGILLVPGMLTEEQWKEAYGHGDEEPTRRP
jgi:hypothetical protein